MIPYYILAKLLKNITQWRIKLMMNTNLENVLLTVNEVAKTLKTNLNTIYELINRGELKGLKLGRIKIPYFEVERFLRDNLGKEVI